MVVDVEDEAGLRGVKGERTVDVGDRQPDDFQGEHVYSSRGGLLRRAAFPDGDPRFRNARNANGI